MTDASAILDLLPHGVLVVARDWRVTYANAEADRLIGRGGDTLWERCPGLEHTAFASGFRYAMSDRSELLTESVLPSVGWCQARARPTAEGLLISLRQVNAHTIETGQARTALLLGEIGEALTREDSLRAALRRCAEGMVRHLEATSARIWTVDERAGALRLCASAGLEVDDGDALASIGARSLGEHKIAEIAADGFPYLTNDVLTDAQVGGNAWVAREQLVAFAGYPLRTGDRIVGVMAMYSKRRLDHDTLNGLSAIADALALGIAGKTADEARRAAERALRKHADNLEVLHHLGQQLAEVLEPAALAQRVADATTRLAGAEAGVFFYPEARETGTAPRLGLASAGTAELADGLATLTPRLADRRALRIADLAAPGSPVAAPAGLPVASFLSVPVIGRSGKGLGSLVFGHAERDAFSDDTERLIASVASTAAVAMDNARLFQEARELIHALEQSNRELDQFAYVASHDLKAPLRGIANLSQWIEDDLGDRLDDQARQHFQLMRGRVSRLENLIAGILAYSRAGRDSADHVAVDVAGLVAEVWELLAPPASARLVIDGALPQLRASRVQLQQVLLNLIGNALKYNAERALTVTVSARRNGRRWELAVADDGVGIAPEFADKIWGLFQTLERRDKVESTGIGLSVVRKIVEQHGGKAWVEPRPGGGAVFWFTWPEAEEIDDASGQ